MENKLNLMSFELTNDTNNSSVANIFGASNIKIKRIVGVATPPYTSDENKKDTFDVDLMRIQWSSKLNYEESVNYFKNLIISIYNATGTKEEIKASDFFSDKQPQKTILDIALPHQKLFSIKTDTIISLEVPKLTTYTITLFPVINNIFTNGTNKNPEPLFS